MTSARLVTLALVVVTFSSACAVGAQQVADTSQQLYWTGYGDLNCGYADQSIAVPSDGCVQGPSYFDGDPLSSVCFYANSADTLVHFTDQNSYGVDIAFDFIVGQCYGEKQGGAPVGTGGSAKLTWIATSSSLRHTFPASHVHDCVNQTITGFGTLPAGWQGCSLTVYGAATAEGDLTTSISTTVDGSLSVAGDMFSGTLQVGGEISVAGNLESDSIDTGGSMSVGRNVDCTGPISIAGALTTPGKVQALSFILTVKNDHASSSATAIMAQSINVTASGGSELAPVLQVSSLCANGAVEVQRTVADTISGDTVILGAGSKTQTLAYFSNYFVDPDASVATITRLSEEPGCSEEERVLAVADA